MAFPNIVFGNDGDQFVTGATQTADVGTRMNFYDGRSFRYAKAGATALVAGELQQSAVPVTGHIRLTPVAAAIGAVQVSLPIVTNAVTVDQYRDGWLCVEVAANTGSGYMYGVGAHAGVAASSSMLVPLRSSVQVAIGTTAASVSLCPNPWRLVVQAATTPTARVCGVCVKPIAISAFGWIQTRGPAMTLDKTTTTVIGQKAIPSTTAGQIIQETVFSVQPTIGYNVRAAADTEYGVTDLILDN